MAAPSLREAFQVGVSILNTVVDKVTGTIMALTGDARAAVSEASEAEWWQQIGFASRPSNPTPTNTEAQGICGETLVMRRGDRDICFASRDIRGQLLSGNLGPGETILYAGGATGTGQARVVLKSNGVVGLMTTDSNTAGGNAVALTLGPTSLNFTAPWGSIRFDASGIHLLTAAGPRLDFGGISIPGIPSSVSGPLTGYFNVTSPVITLNGSIVNLGPGPYGTVLAAPSALLAPGAPSTTVMTGASSQCASIRATTP